jgi:hypothetical protein
MAGGNGDHSQYLSLVGVNLPHVGYGKMVSGLRSALASRVELCDDAERVVFALRPNLNICIISTPSLFQVSITGNCSQSSMTMFG